MMVFIETRILLLISCLLLYSGDSTSVFSYDYYATTKCLVEPRKALYGGGIIVNPEFNDGIKGWTFFRQGNIEEQASKEGNRFIVSPSNSLSQQVHVEEGKVYSFSAWVQVSEGSETIAVIFRPAKGNITYGGSVIANHGCWTLLKGGMVANFSTTVDILFESQNPTVEIWADSVSLQPFTKKQWRSHHDQSINKVRRSKLSFQVTDANRTPIEGTEVSIKQTKSHFPFGCGMNHNILTSTDYQNWFASRFKATTFTNEMKWYSTEKQQGQENYTIADAMLEFCKSNEIFVRGHNIFWDNPTQQPQWVKSLPPDQLRNAAAKRINSVVSRYRGQLIAWDVMNENLHFRFFEDKLGENASAEYYYIAQQLDPKTTMFMNEYNTIEYGGDMKSSPLNYKKKLEEIVSFPGNANLSAGIGVQGHFVSDQPNLAYMRSALDILATTGFPIWLTEVSVDNDPNQAQYLEEILREGYSHPAVEGIIMFAGPAVAGFNETTLADKEFKTTPSGDVVDKLIAEWKFETMTLKTDKNGFIDVSLFHGDYDLLVKHPLNTNSSATLSLTVRKDEPQASVHFQINT